MKKNLNPSDLGNYSTLEWCRKINVDELVKEINKNLKKVILEAKINALNVEIGLTTTKTRFGGEKFWFICLECGSKRGVLYFSPSGSKLLCRKCLRVYYSKQRYKGMLERQ